MNQPHFSLSYEGHRKYLCEGLSNLQQNGEFVDMTIAADGHYVKVHKIIMSLASSYFKEIISTAPGQHPMIYLNKVSYGTLSAILEYIYTGEAHIEIEKLDEFTQVSKDLHIKGLDSIITQDLKTRYTTSSTQSRPQEIDHFAQLNESTDDHVMDITNEGNMADVNDCFAAPTQTAAPPPVDPISDPIPVDNRLDKPTKLLYTLSNKNCMMVIFNRYIYRLNYIYKRSGNRYQWKCINERQSKCPALLISENDRIIKRSFVHNHPFDDKKILKKMANKAVFTTITDAEKQAKQPVALDNEDDE